jgi:hypothetical protein
LSRKTAEPVLGMHLKWRTRQLFWRMREFVMGWFRLLSLTRAVLFDAGAAIIFFGSLIQQPEIAEYGARALQELRVRGYEIPTAAEPVRAYPATTTGSFGASHAGGWRPGVIALRQNPVGTAGVEAYLRHELMHEAAYRTCKGNLPLWAEEAAAISFSMESLPLPVDKGGPGRISPAVLPHASTSTMVELPGPCCTNRPTVGELADLRRRVRVGAGLDPENYRVLAALVSCYGWPSKPCARSETIERLLRQPPPPGETGFSFLLVSLISGRTLESQGDLSARYPPGSLLKIPYAAALRDSPAEALGKELAASDTEKLLARKDTFDFERFRFLISPVKDSALGVLPTIQSPGNSSPPILPTPPSQKGGAESPPPSTGQVGGSLAPERRTESSLPEKSGPGSPPFRKGDLGGFSDRLRGQSIQQNRPACKGERFWRQYVGEREEAGSFPLEANLPELAQILRASLLYRPDYFSGLSQNGFLEASTLYREPDKDKKILEKLHALSKTGTVADERGNPLMGHLLVAWPAEEPAFLAVFRSFGVNGAGNLRRASKLLEKWAVQHPSRSRKVRVRILTLAPRSSWEVLDDCPAFEREGAKGWKERISICGRFRVVSVARGSRPERLVSGILSSSQDGQTVVLETDPETYADAVLAAEAQELQGEARKALRAAIVWNGTHGPNRHEDSLSLCDTTHCMVFQGSLPEAKQERGSHTDPKLLKLLDDLAASKKLDWLPFSKGGNQPWVKEVPISRLLALVDEASILDLRRERTRSGEVVIHLMYPDNEEVVSCEVFRNRLKLLSCPETIQHDDSKSTWVFSGIGEGHGEGLSVAKARGLSRAGHPASVILTDAYQ